MSKKKKEEEKEADIQKNDVMLFQNWTDEPFTWKWDGKPYTFKAGQSIFLEAFKAHHFAKHLTDREMNRARIATDHHSRNEFYSKCFGSIEGEEEGGEDDEQLTPKDKVINKNEKKKEEKKVEKAKKDEFPDLKKKDKK